MDLNEVVFVALPFIVSIVLGVGFLLRVPRARGGA